MRQISDISAMVGLSRTAILTNTRVNAIGHPFDVVGNRSIHALEEYAFRFLAWAREFCGLTRFFHLALVFP
jgi:hypothetical protein